MVGVSVGGSVSFSCLSGGCQCQWWFSVLLMDVIRLCVCARACVSEQVGVGVVCSICVCTVVCVCVCGGGVVCGLQDVRGVCCVWTAWYQRCVLCVDCLVSEVWTAWCQRCVLCVEYQVSVVCAVCGLLGVRGVCCVWTTRCQVCA